VTGARVAVIVVVGLPAGGSGIRGVDGDPQAVRSGLPPRISKPSKRIVILVVIVSAAIPLIRPGCEARDLVFP